MLTVIWGMDGFYVVNLMTKQHSYNPQYFISHILEPLLLTAFLDDCKPHPRRLRLHRDNGRVHCSKFSDNISPKIILFECPVRLTILI
jgi:hypothetical protein